MRARLRRSAPWPPLLAALLGTAPAAPAQDPAPTQAAAEARIGVFFWHDSPNDDHTLAGVRRGLSEAGTDVRFVIRRADSDTDAAARLLAELDGLGCRLVLSLGTRATQLAVQHLERTPIVFAAVTNPVTAGIVSGWGETRQGLRGASNWIAPEGVLEVFRLAVPELRALGMLRSTSSGTVSEAERTDMQRYLEGPDAPPVTLHEAVVDDSAQLPQAIEALRSRGVDAIWIPIDLTIYTNVAAIERALGDRPLPLLTTAAAGVRNGALVGAAVDYELHGRRAAALIQLALRRPDGAHGAGPRPVDRMRSSLVVVNLRAARSNGIELPLSLLALADELIAAEER